MSSFSWIIHNGRDFGQHEALDNKLNTKLTTSFLKDTPDIVCIDIYLIKYDYIFIIF